MVDALAPGARLAYATRLGPETVMQHTHEYASLVRLTQSLAGLTWRHRIPTRRQVATARWRRQVSYHPYYEVVSIEDILIGAGLIDVEHDIDIHERPSRPLRWHINEITLGAGSQMLRFTGVASDWRTDVEPERGLDH